MRVFQHLLITVILSLWLILRLIRRRGLPPTPLNPLLYLCALVWFASALLSLDPRMALENLWFPLTNLLLFFVMVDLLQSGREALLVETQFLLAALVVILAGAQLGSWLFGWGFATSRIGWLSVLSPEMPLPIVPPRLFVPLGVSTWLAAYSAPLALLAAAWGVAARRRAVRASFWMLAALLVIVMLLTNSRGGWISVGAGAAVFALLELARRPRLQQVVRRYALPIGIAVVAVVAAGVLALVAIGSDPGHSSGDVLRFDLWRGAVEIARDHPFFGVGPGLFGQAYRLYRNAGYVDNRLGTAHNFYLNSLAETGIVGALVGLALAFVLLRAWWRLWRSADAPSRKLHLEGALAALVGFGAQSSFDTFTVTPLALLALGLTAYCVTAARTRIDPPLRGSRPAAFVSLILVLGFGVGLFRSDQAQAAFSASVRDSSLDEAQQASALDPALHLYDLQVAYLTDGDPATAAAGYQRALALEPTWATGWINLAALDQRQNEIPQALDALQHAIDIDNQNGALLLWARLAESADAAPPDTIVNTYIRALKSRVIDDLPLSDFWTQTDLRQQALAAYQPTLPLDLRYRVLAAHDPSALAALVPTDPVTAQEWWVTGEYALNVNGDARAAEAAFTQAVARHGYDAYLGDYYVARARARVTLDPAAAQHDLNIAELLGALYESPNAVRAQLTDSLDEKRQLWATAVPPHVIDQNFEGVLFAGRVASFDLLPEMRPPGPGREAMQPWYDLAESYQSTGEIDKAITVYRAILDRAPDEQDARAELDQPERGRIVMLKRAAFTLLILYVLLVGSTYDGILDGTRRVADVLLVGVVVAVWLWSRRRWQWHRTALDWAILLWCAAFALSLLTNLESWRRILIGIWFMGVYIGAWYVLQDAFANRALRREWLVDALLIAGVPVVFVGYAQVEVALTGGLPLPRPVGTLGNANALAAFLVMLIPFALGRTIGTRSPLARVALGFYSVMALGLIFLSYSRGGWFGAAVAVAVWVSLRFPVRRWWAAQSGALRGTLLVGGAAALITVLLLVGETFGIAGRTVELRTWIYDTAIQLFAERPLTGHGLFTFGAGLSRLNSLPPMEPHSHAHNIVLNVAAETGIVGVSALILTCVLALRALRRPTDPITIMAAAAFAGFAAHQVVDLPAMLPAIALVALFALALALPAGEALVGKALAGKALARARWQPLLMAAGAVVLVAGGLWDGVNYNAYVTALSDAAVNGDYHAAADHLQPLIDADPGLAVYPQQQGMLFGLAAAAGDAQAAQAGVDAFRRYLSLEPDYASGWANLAALYEGLGENNAPPKTPCARLPNSRRIAGRCSTASGCTPKPPGTAPARRGLTSRRLAPIIKSCCCQIGINRRCAQRFRWMRASFPASNIPCCCSNAAISMPRGRRGMRRTPEAPITAAITSSTCCSR